MRGQIQVRREAVGRGRAGTHTTQWKNLRIVVTGSVAPVKTWKLHIIKLLYKFQLVNMEIICFYTHLISYIRKELLEKQRVSSQ